MNNFITFDDFRKKLNENYLNSANQNSDLNNSNTKEILPPLKDNENKKPVLKPQSSLKDNLELSQKLEKAKKQNGLAEKLADKIKSKFNFGISSKSIERKINENTDSLEIENDIKNYKRQQENVIQTAGDIASCLGSIAVFFNIKQAVQKISAKYFSLNEDWFKEITKNTELKGMKKSLLEFAKNHAAKKSTAIVLGTAGAFIAGGFIKNNLLKLNRIGTSQYKPEITPDMDEEEIKTAKKEAKRERKNANRRNKWSGRINGLLTPLLAIGGGLGAPVYAAANSLNRYFIASREDRKEKSISSYVENLKNSSATNIIGAAMIMTPAFLKGRADKVFGVNLEKAISKLKNANQSTPSFSKTTYEQLEDIIFGDKIVNEIINDASLSTSEKIQKLTDYNIFAVKFKQINASTDDLTAALKSQCPPTRTVEEAQKILNDSGLGEYKIIGEKAVGTGTVAETYLAKKGDKEVCIKMLKDGITREKIEKDKAAFIEIINQMEDKTREEKEFLIKNIENIAQGVLEETDLNNEMAAAQELAKVTRVANVVKPIEVKNNIYVMEKAKGVNLSDFSIYTRINSRYSKMSQEELQNKITELQKDIERCKNKADEAYFDGEREMYESFIKYDSQEMDELKKYMELKNNKEFSDLIINLTSDEMKKLLLAYQDVLVEQFSKVDGKEKIIHGDIHPGNIFIDLEALKRGDKKIFTLIDTGNTIKQTPESAIRFLNLSRYIKNADTESIVDFVLKDAKLPKNIKSQDEAKKLVLNELNKIFFDAETELGEVSVQTLLAITDGIMQKHNIIPADTQGGLIKAQNSAKRSLQEFVENFFSKKGDELNERFDNSEINQAALLGAASEGADMVNTLRQYPKKQKRQENLNLLLSPKAKILAKGSKTAPKKNSEEYLTYYLKQGYSNSKDKNPAQALGAKAGQFLGDYLGIDTGEF